MPKYVYKLTDPRDGRVYYGEWTTISDAPASGLFASVEGLTAHVRRRYGEEGVRELPERLARVERHGTSAHDGRTAGRLIARNRAGEGETELTAEQIIDQYRGPGGGVCPEQSGVNFRSG